VSATDHPYEPGPELFVTTRHEDDCVVLALEGELDLATGPLLAQALLATGAGPTAPPRLALDLSALAFADVVGLGVVLRHERVLARSGGTVELRHPSTMVRRIVTTLALQDRLHLVG
jgi:anti-anti-sigma factor